MCPMKSLQFFYNGSNYDYYSIIQELENEFKGQFECLGENIQKYKTFSVPIEKEVTKLIKIVMKALKLYLIK